MINEVQIGGLSIRLDNYNLSLRLKGVTTHYVAGINVDSFINDLASIEESMVIHTMDHYKHTVNAIVVIRSGLELYIKADVNMGELISISVLDKSINSAVHLYYKELTIELCSGCCNCCNVSYQGDNITSTIISFIDHVLTNISCARIVELKGVEQEVLYS